MVFKPGQSGNPKGRPHKRRALTEILEATGSKTITTNAGKKVARKQLIAELMWAAATEGKITMPDGSQRVVPLADQLTALRWVYQHIDGKPGDVAEGEEEQAPASMDALLARMSNEDLSAVEEIISKYTDA